MNDTAEVVKSLTQEVPEDAPVWVVVGHDYLCRNRQTIKIMQAENSICGGRLAFIGSNGREYDKSGRRSWYMASGEDLVLDLTLSMERMTVMPDAPVAPAHDPVNYPAHYTAHPSGIECIQITEHMDFCLGNAMKYLWRAGQKDGHPTTQELRKAIWYVERKIAQLEPKSA